MRLAGGSGKLLAGGVCALVCHRVVKQHQLWPSSLACFPGKAFRIISVKDNLRIQPGSDGRSSASFLCCDLDLWQFLPYAENNNGLLGCSTEGRVSWKTGFIAQEPPQCNRLGFLLVSGIEMTKASDH